MYQIASLEPRGKTDQCTVWTMTERPGAPQVTMKLHRKVRTGCITCKIRHKKCDETKPACRRCTSTGRKCDGYAPVGRPRQAQRNSEISLATNSSAIPIKTSKQIFAASSLPTIDHDGVSSEVGTSIAAISEQDVTEFYLAYDLATGRCTNSTSSRTSTFTPESISPQTPSAVVTGHNQDTFKPPGFHVFQPLVNSPGHSPNFFPPTYRMTDLELHCFSYFRQHTGPQFASYFDSSIWRAYMTGGVPTHPVLFTAAAALGAVHRRFTYGISKEALEYCGHAANLGTKALKELEALKKQSVNYDIVGTSSMGGTGIGIYDRDVIMLAEILMAMFETFQTNRDEAMAHMGRGVKYLLHRPLTISRVENRYCAVESKPNTFRNLFHQILCRAMQLFETPTNILVRWGQGKLLPNMPVAFESLDQARDYIFTEFYWILNAPVKLSQNEVQRYEAQVQHVNRLVQWSLAYTRFIRGMRRTPVQKTACMLLQLTRNATYLFIYATLFVSIDSTLPKLPDIHEVDDDSGQHQGLVVATRALWEMILKRDELNISLGRVKALIDHVLDKYGIFKYEEYSTGMNAALPSPQNIDTPVASRLPPNQRANSIMQKVSTSNQSSNILDLYGIAISVTNLEERAMIEAIKRFVPPHIDPRMVDATVFIEDRQVVLRYCQPDALGFGIMWTQEWWAF